jgi:hypothetical protein
VCIGTEEDRLIEMMFRFIKTPIMSENVLERLAPALKKEGSEFAEVEDSVKAVLKIACDEGINGM